MEQHAFIFSPGVWQGSGNITFSMASDVLEFTMKWIVLPLEEERIHFHQEIDIKSFPEKMSNHFTLRQSTPTSFEIALENTLIGKVAGSGIISPLTIAWEFRKKDQEFEGYEIYELQPDKSYKMRAEFSSGDGLRTSVTGSISKLTQFLGLEAEEEEYQ